MNHKKNSVNNASTILLVTDKRVVQAGVTRAMLPKKLVWVRKGAAAVADQGLLSGSSLVVSVFLGRYLPAEQYGAYAVAFSIFLFISGVHNAMLVEPMSVFGPASYADRISSYLGSMTRLHFALCGPLSVVLGAAVLISARWLGSTTVKSALLGACVAMPFILFYWLWRKAAYVEFKPSVAMLGASTYCGVLLSLLLLLYRARRLSPFTAFLLMALASLVASAVIIISLRRKRTSLDARVIAIATILRENWGYGRWVIGSSWFSSDAYYVVVGGILGMKGTAALRALQNLVLPVGHFITAISLLLIPWLSGYFVRSDAASFRRTVRALSFLFIGSAITYVVALLLRGRWLLDVLYKGKYTEFAHLLPLIALPLLLNAASQATTLALRAMRAPSGIFYGYIAAGLVTPLAGLALTRSWGLAGALLATSTSYVVFFVIVSMRFQSRIRNLISADAEYDGNPSYNRDTGIDPRTLGERTLEDQTLNGLGFR